ncbi:MAG: type II toxin-antitoxin system VapC family toxin [Acidobacteriota bacterium]
MIILDTNVLSELMKPAPSFDVVDWIKSRATHELHATSITQAEILYGIHLLPEGRRRDAFAAAASAMFEADFAGRILAFDSDAARAYADIVATRRRAGHPISQFDAQVAAIARDKGAVVATRNVTDFEGCGVEVFNPWSA